MRRIASRATAVALLVAAALVAACGAQDERRAGPPPAGAGGPLAGGPAQLRRALPEVVLAPPPRPRPHRAARPRCPAAPTSTVAGALRRALRCGRVSRAEHARLRRIDAAARAAVRRLGGTRRAELRAVVAAADRLARAHRLTAGRFGAVFLTLRRNTEVWTRRPLPRPGKRLRFGADPVVFQYMPGRGVQAHPLASWGRLNAAARGCLRRGGRKRCPRGDLRRAIDRLAALATPRGGAPAWEYLFAFGHSAPPWVSGMAQATAAQALARAAQALHAPAYARLARSSLAVFERPPPAGVAAPARGGRRYVMYSGEPRLRILNGELQAVTGLRDVGTLLRSATARRLAGRGLAAARAALPSFDTGAWSLYAQRGAESSLHYHRLTKQFLGGLCRRTHERRFCAARRRFHRYEHEPPRLRLTPAGRLRPLRATRLSFTLSKVARVAVRVWSARGLVLRRDLRLARGRHDLRWVPLRAGRYRVRIEAVGPSGPHGVLARTLRVKAPRERPSHRRTRRARGR